jgi:hypothetical protein
MPTSSLRKPAGLLGCFQFKKLFTIVSWRIGSWLAGRSARKLLAKPCQKAGEAHTILD